MPDRQHQPYEIGFNDLPDFRVRYRFFSKDEGGRTNPPMQGYRPDFWYDTGELGFPQRIYMIHPEFEDVSGNIITDGNIPVNNSGHASMWIKDPGWREFHRMHISVGTKGFFMEGGTRVAECEVIEICGLMTNPSY